MMPYSIELFACRVCLPCSWHISAFRPRRRFRGAEGLGAEATGQICQTGTDTKAQKKCMGLWPFARFADRPKIVQMHCFDPTLARLGANFGGKAPTSAQLRLMAPTSTQRGSKMAQLGPPIWEQLRPKLGPTRLHNGRRNGPIRNPPNARFHCYVRRFFPTLPCGFLFFLLHPASSASSASAASSSSTSSTTHHQHDTINTTSSTQHHQNTTPSTQHH